MKKIKVMQITHDLNVGGLQRVVVDIAKNINKGKYEIVVCALRSGGPLESELLKNNIKVIILNLNSKTVNYFGFLKLYKAIKNEKPDILHTHNTQPLMDGVVAGILYGSTRIVHTDHGRIFPDKKRYMFIEKIFSHVIRQYIAVSEDTKKKIAENEKIQLDKILVIRNGIAMDIYEKSEIDVNKKKYELNLENRNGPFLGVCARITRQKGIEYLLRAVKYLQAEFPDIVLLVVGDGEALTGLKMEAKQLGIENNVLFLGERRDISELLSILDVFVLPSLSEGLPISILEAMSASVPVVSTDVGGVREVIEDKVNGFIVPPMDVEALVENIRLLLLNANVREDFSNKSLEILKNNFSINNMLEKYETVYNNCFF